MKPRPRLNVETTIIDMKYLKRYQEWIKTGRMTYDGLCSCFGYSDEIFKLFYPIERYEDVGYWAFVGERPCEAYKNARTTDVWNEFTPLRQNIILFMAAMNGEL
jgi:hypothetical protein